MVGIKHNEHYLWKYTKTKKRKYKKASIGMIALALCVKNCTAFLGGSVVRRWISDSRPVMVVGLNPGQRNTTVLLGKDVVRNSR